MSAAYEALRQLGQWTAIIHIPRCQAACQQLTLVVDHQVQLEAVEPIDRILAALGQPRKNALVFEAAMVTDHQLGRIDEREAMTRAPAGVQLRGPRNEDGRHEGHEAAVTDQPRKVRLHVSQDLLDGERFELSKMGLVKEDQDRHDASFPRAGRCAGA
jgi:hypothetical protein